MKVAIVAGGAGALEDVVNTIETEVEGEPLLRLRPRRGWQAINATELWHYRDLLWFLAARDIRVRYKQTVLGVLWALLQPVAAMVSW